MSYTVRTGVEPDYTLCEDEMTASVLQNVALIINTRKGTVPLYRDFGLNMDYLDKPANIAATLAAQDVQAAIDEYEPRAKVRAVSAECDLKGRLIISVEVDINE